METINAWGHENVLSGHGTTIEITKDAHLTKRGDCIIGVASDKGLIDLSSKFKANAARKNARIAVTFKAGEITETVTGRGHPDLTFIHETDIVIRKSSFICPRTLMIGSDKSARELDRRLISLLKNKNQKLEVSLEILGVK